MPEKTVAQKKAQQKYMEKFAVARVRMNKDRYELVQAHAEARGESVNGFINRAIDNQISQDRRKGPSEAAQAPLEREKVYLPSEREKGQETAQNGVTAKED